MDIGNNDPDVPDHGEDPSQDNMDIGNNDPDVPDHGEDSSQDGKADIDHKDSIDMVSEVEHWTDENGHEHVMETEIGGLTTHTESWSDEQDGVKVDHEIKEVDGGPDPRAHVTEREIAHYEDGSSIETVSEYSRDTHDKDDSSMESYTVTDVSDEDHPVDIEKQYFDDNGELSRTEYFDKEGNLESISYPDGNDTENVNNDVDTDSPVDTDVPESVDYDVDDDDDDGYDQVDFG